jgi:hypothetical protein
MLHLGDHQIRLLLCRPDHRTPIGTPPEGVRLEWRCGCTAVERERKRYAVEPCAYHRGLLAHISEAEEPNYEGNSSATSA